VVKVCLIIAIVFTYPMQLFPVTEIFDFVFLKKASENLFDVKVCQPSFILSFFHSFMSASTDSGLGCVCAQGNLIRVVCCLFTATIAFFVPFFGLISGLIGALGSSFLAFILPGTTLERSMLMKTCLSLLLLLTRALTRGGAQWSST
jgi:hypothetical protein